jgi:hypothetical protein
MEYWGFSSTGNLSNKWKLVVSLHSGHFIPEVIAVIVTGIHWLGGWVAPQSVWAFSRREFRCLCRQSNRHLLLLQPVACLDFRYRPETLKTILHPSLNPVVASCCVTLAIVCDILSFTCSSIVTFKKYSVGYLVYASPPPFPYIMEWSVGVRRRLVEKHVLPTHLFEVCISNFWVLCLAGRLSLYCYILDDAESVKIDFSATKGGLNLFFACERAHFLCSQIQRIDGWARAPNPKVTHIYSVVSIVTTLQGVQLRIRNSITASGRVFSPLKSVQTGLWAQSVLCSMATGGLYSRGQSGLGVKLAILYNLM